MSEKSKEFLEKPETNGFSTVAINGEVDNIKKDNNKEPSEGSVERGQWGAKAEFMLSCIGYSVGFGNVWRFPHLAYSNGGAAFVIAYIILQVLIGKPMYMMELILGQFSGKGPTGCWAMNPSAKGVGISMVMVSLIVAIYYNVITAYTLYFLFASMQKVLPWTVCKDEWIPLGCVASTQKKLAECTENLTLDTSVSKCKCSPSNFTLNSYLEDNNITCSNVSNVAASELYFQRTVIQRAPNMYPDEVGVPIWQLALCLLLAWILVVLCLIKGIKSSGKIVYFTATFPYVVLLILLVRGCLLDGAIDGVKFFAIPKWKKLKDLKVWVAAAGQMFFSLGLAFGGIIMYSSYNKFNNNVYNDALIISSMDLITSIISGFVIFTNLGGMAKKVGVDIEDVAKSGYGLAFVAYPEALSNLPVPQIWSILFFFMLFTLGLDSEFATLETVLTCLQDEFVQLRKYKKRIIVLSGVVLYLIALPCITPAGDYIVALMDHYGCDFAILFVGVCECISVTWVYGIQNFLKDCTYMLGRPPRPMLFWAFCWTISAPLLVAALFIYRMIDYKPPTISDDVPFPEFAMIIGWIMTTIVLIPIPGMLIYTFIRAKGDFLQRVRIITTPTSDWKPNDGSDSQPLDNPYKLDILAGLDNPGATFTHL